jgi:hypothetical protein
VPNNRSSVVKVGPCSSNAIILARRDFWAESPSGERWREEARSDTGGMLGAGSKHQEFIEEIVLRVLAC